MMDTLGDSLLNAFAKIRKPDPQFVEMKDRVDRLEENFVVLEKTLSRANKRTEGKIYKRGSSSDSCAF
jgi:sorting nexin-4